MYLWLGVGMWYTIWCHSTGSFNVHICGSELVCGTPFGATLPEGLMYLWLEVGMWYTIWCCLPIYRMILFVLELVCGTPFSAIYAPEVFMCLFVVRSWYLVHHLVLLYRKVSFVAQSDGLNN
jgi:hypothetical protein